ncbi:MAG: hypothetical protein E7257_01640 [Lachnospiraceae bacterium]|nr:hypothetical protein [Lachnospiraceae bacterium]
MKGRIIPMKIIKRRKVIDVISVVLLTIYLVSNISLNISHAKTSDESGIIIDYNPNYYDSYDEFIGDDSAHFNYDEGNILSEGSSNLEEIVPNFNTIDEAGAYLRACMVDRSGEVEFIFSNQEGYSGAEGFAAIKSATFVETDSPKEGDYLYWNYAGLQGSFDMLEEGIKYILKPSYLSTAGQEDEIDEKVNSLLCNEFAGWESMDEFSRIKMAYKWVTYNFTFVGGSDRHSTYSGIIEYETVCQGFSSTMYRLLREMGISCRVISNEAHGWNIVKIGDYYYNIDATWDVKTKESKWSNFLLSNSSFELGEMHTRGARYTTEEFNLSYPMSNQDYQWIPEEEQLGVEYKTHIQTTGWQDWKIDGATSGTTGKSKRLEAIKIHLTGTEYKDIDLEYMSHIQSVGWEADWKASDSVSGTEGKSKRLEAIKIKLIGKDAKDYDIYYRVHVQTFGWLGWAKNGECAGTTGMSKRLEGIEITVLPKGEAPEGMIGYSYIAYGKTALLDENNQKEICYNAHVQTYGWQKPLSDGSISGTFGEGKRLEAFKISLEDVAYDGGVAYRSYIAGNGWESDWKYDEAISGTTGQGKALDAVQIKLYGQAEEEYDIYYRVHIQTYGWLDWVKNGDIAGLEGKGKRVEAIQIVLIPKNLPGPK